MRGGEDDLDRYEMPPPRSAAVVPLPPPLPFVPPSRSSLQKKKKYGEHDGKKGTREAESKTMTTTKDGMVGCPLHGVALGGEEGGRLPPLLRMAPHCGLVFASPATPVRMRSPLPPPPPLLPPPLFRSFLFFFFLLRRRRLLLDVRQPWRRRRRKAHRATAMGKEKKAFAGVAKNASQKMADPHHSPPPPPPPPLSCPSLPLLLLRPHWKPSSSFGWGGVVFFASRQPLLSSSPPHTCPLVHLWKGPSRALLPAMEMEMVLASLGTPSREGVRRDIPSCEIRPHTRGGGYHRHSGGETHSVLHCTAWEFLENTSHTRWSASFARRWGRRGGMGGHPLLLAPYSDNDAHCHPHRRSTVPPFRCDGRRRHGPLVRARR